MTLSGIAAGAWAGCIFLSALSGCLSFGDRTADDPVAGGVDLAARSVQDGLDRIRSLREDPLVLPADVTINVVFAGLDMANVDQDAVRAALPRDYSPRIPFGEDRGGDLRSGLVQRVQYEFHQAPAEFATALFGMYPELSREDSIPRVVPGEPSFLERYDAMYQLERATSGSVHIVDAQKVEAWIEAHREGAGLRFEQPEYTIFFLDSYSQHGLWTDSYYWYEYANESTTNPDAINLRAWGGTFGFLFLDYSAAPNNALFDNVGIANLDVLGPGATPVPVPAPEGTAYNDPPIWHYRGGTGSIGLGPLQKTVTLTDRVRHALDVAVNLRILGDYLLPPIYAERYHLNVHLWHDGRSLIPQGNLDQFLNVESLFAGLRAEVPWSNLTGSLTTYVAPRDDPGMADALNLAKAEGAGTYIPTQPITNYVDAHSERYRSDAPEALQIMALLFLLEGHYTFVLPLIVGGVALESPDGLGWGTISNVNDYRYIASERDTQRIAKELIDVNAHEIGHYFGLFHAHDGYRRASTGYEPFSDHTWSSTNTAMSYRLRPPTTDRFHVDHLARGHTLQNLEQALRNVESIYRALSDANLVETPGPVFESLRTASMRYDHAVELYDGGEFQRAVQAAIESRRATEQGAAAVHVVENERAALTWSTNSVFNAGAKASAVTLRPAVSPTGVKFDYRPLTVDVDMERITVRVSWINGPASWGDFFAGWQFEGSPDPLGTGPIPLGRYVDVGGGVHDARDEGPLDGAAVEEFTLDLDSYPGLRQGETILVGAGTRGNAVNGGYEVEVVVGYREYGNGYPS